MVGIFCTVVYLILVQMGFCITPLKRLVSNPEEHTKPLSIITENILAAMNEELSAAQDYYRRRMKHLKEHSESRKVHRGFQVSFLQRSGTIPLAEFDDLTSYLILEESQVSCDGRDLLKVEKAELATFDNARRTCDELAGCSYFTWRPGNEARKGVVWYCAGNGWMFSRRENGWVVATKKKQFHLKNFLIRVNMAIHCTGKEKLKTLVGDSLHSMMFMMIIISMDLLTWRTFMNGKKVE